MNSRFVKYATIASIIGGTAIEATDFYKNLTSEYSIEQKDFLNETFTSSGLESKLKNN
jgi:hypothetical protein